MRALRDGEDELGVIIDLDELDLAAGAEVNGLVHVLGLNVELVVLHAIGDPGEGDNAFVGGDSCVLVLDFVEDGGEVEVLGDLVSLALLDLGDLLVGDVVGDIEVGDDLSEANVGDIGLGDDLLSVASDVNVGVDSGVGEGKVLTSGLIVSVQGAEGHVVARPLELGPFLVGLLVNLVGALEELALERGKLGGERGSGNSSQH